MPFHSQGVFIFAALICVIADNYQCVDAQAICPSPIKGMFYLGPKPTGVRCPWEHWKRALTKEAGISNPNSRVDKGCL